MQKSVLDSDDDLDGFLAGLRQRYNLGDEPSPAPSNRLARSTDANIFGQGHSASRPTISPEYYSAAQYGASDDRASEEACQPARGDAYGAEQIGEAGPADDAVLQNTTAAASTHLDDQTEHQAVAPSHESGSPSVTSESASCPTPWLQSGTQTQLATAEAATAAPNQTPTGNMTVHGRGIAAAATPHTTAAMPAAWAARAAVQDTTAAVMQTAAQPSTVAGHAAAQETEAYGAVRHAISPQPQAAVDAGGSDDTDSPSSIKKPLYGAFLAAAAPADGDTPAAAASTGVAAAAGRHHDMLQGYQTTDETSSAATPTAAQKVLQETSGSGLASPASSAAPSPGRNSTAGTRRIKRNVSFNDGVTAQHLGHDEQQQQQQQQQGRQLQESPSSVWKRRSNSPTRGVLKHDQGPLQEQAATHLQHGVQEQQGGQQHQQHPLLQQQGGQQHQQHPLLQQQGGQQHQQHPLLQQQGASQQSPQEDERYVLYRDLTLRQDDVAQQQQQLGEVVEQQQMQAGSALWQQQRQTPAADSPLQQQQQQRWERSVLSPAMTAALAGTSTAAVMTGFSSISSTRSSMISNASLQPEHDGTTPRPAATAAAAQHAMSPGGLRLSDLWVQHGSVSTSAAAAAAEAALNAGEAETASTADAPVEDQQAPTDTPSASNPASVPSSQQEQEPAAAPEAAAAAAAAAAAPMSQPAAASDQSNAADWSLLSDQLSMAGFGPLQLREGRDKHVLPETGPLFSLVSRVLREYQRRDSLMSQLLSERDELRRESGRAMTEYNKLERQRDDAIKAAEKAKVELSDVRKLEIPAIESKHKDALSKLHSEVAKLKHALKEAEQAAAAAQAAAAGGEMAALQQQLQDVIKDKERLIIENERLTSELNRQKPYIRDLERAAAAARAAAKQSDETAGLLERQLRELKQQQQDEVTTLGAELTKARHMVREAEQQLAALRAETASDNDAAQTLLKQLSSERQQHEEQQAYLSSELHKLRQQLLQLQSATAKAESAAKADSSAAVFSGKQLAAMEKQHGAEMSKLQAELRQAREQGQLMQARLAAAEAAAADHLTAATSTAAEALQQSQQADALQQELDKQRNSSRQHLQHLGQQLLEARKSLAENEQQLASTQAELRRLRAAAALVDATGAGAAAAGMAADLAQQAADADRSAAAGGGGGFSVTPTGSARVAGRQPAAAAAAPATSDVPSSPSGGVEPVMDSNSNGSNVSDKLEDPDIGTGAAAAAAAAAVLSDVDLAAALGRAVRAEAAVADAEQQLVALRYKMLQLEATCNRREKETDALRDRLADKVVKEERRLARDKQAYARIRQAYAQSKRPTATTPAGLGLAALGGSEVAARRAAAGAVAAAARELRPVELVGIYESQKEVMEKELAAAKAEVRVLSGQLRDAQNLLISKDRSAAVAAAAAGLKGNAVAGLGDPAAAVAAQRKAAELQRELCSVRADAASALREAAKRLAESEAVVKSLREDNEGLQAELQGRPTLQEFKQQKREIDLLQRKIATLRRQAATAAAGGAAAAGEDSLQLAAAAVAAGDAWASDGSSATAAGFRALTSRSTKSAMERDKAIARLGLGVVEEYPRDVLIDLIQDVCVVLELNDATLLLPNLRKMAAVVAAIPKLEAFVAQVCECCFRQGIMFVPAAAQQHMNPGTVPQVLQHWVQLLQQGEQLRLLTQQLQHLLAQRSSSGSSTTDPAAANSTLALANLQLAATGEAMHIQQLQQLRQQVLQQVEQLLHIESAAVAASDVVAAAEGLMADRPEGLLQQLLAQVQHLFDIPSLEGVPAAMNKVYVHYSELCNFFKAVANLLALPDDAGPAAAMAAINNVIQQSVKPPSKVRAAAAELQRAAGLENQPPAQQAAAEAGREAEQQRDAATGALQALLAAMGTGSVQGTVTKHQEMKQRLERLDEVLPRYQRLAAELYDRLRVVTLDDILPALDKVLAAADQQ